jgi:hypothetical protein
VLAQQAEEPVTLVATPPIRRAQSRLGSGESWRCDRKEAISGAQGRSARPRDGAVEYRRGVEMMLRWGRLWRRKLCLQNEGRVVLKSRAQSRASLPTRKPQTARPDFIRPPPAIERVSLLCPRRPPTYSIPGIQASSIPAIDCYCHSLCITALCMRVLLRAALY